tara:strand:+ start:1993 stop:2232 length:240 start_codon:yes stop_codon:yes gene_type:complete
MIAREFPEFFHDFLTIEEAPEQENKNQKLIKNKQIRFLISNKLLFPLGNDIHFLRIIETWRPTVFYQIFCQYFQWRRYM